MADGSSSLLGGALEPSLRQPLFKCGTTDLVGK